MNEINSTVLEDDDILEYHPMEDPREDDNLGILGCFHPKYDLTDKGVPFKAEMFEGWDEMEDYITGTLRSLVCLPVYMYDHSGITVSTSPFSCNWDSGQIGWIYTTAKRVGEIGFKQEEKESWSDYIARMKAALEAEVKVYDDYVTSC